MTAGSRAGRRPEPIDDGGRAIAARKRRPPGSALTPTHPADRVTP